MLCICYYSNIDKYIVVKISTPQETAKTNISTSRSKNIKSSLFLIKRCILRTIFNKQYFMRSLLKKLNIIFPQSAALQFDAVCILHGVLPPGIAPAPLPRRRGGLFRPQSNAVPARLKLHHFPARANPGLAVLRVQPGRPGAQQDLLQCLPVAPLDDGHGAPVSIRIPRNHLDAPAAQSMSGDRRGFRAVLLPFLRAIHAIKTDFPLLSAVPDPPQEILQDYRDS